MKLFGGERKSAPAFEEHARLFLPVRPVVIDVRPGMNDDGHTVRVRRREDSARTLGSWGYRKFSTSVRSLSRRSTSGSMMTRSSAETVMFVPAVMMGGAPDGKRTYSNWRPLSRR